MLANTGSLVDTGYVFDGWNTAANGSGTSYSAGATLTIAADTVLYAQWSTAPQYTLTYDGNGNTAGSPPSDPSSPYYSGTSATVLANSGNLVDTGYVFGGWNTAANGSGTAYAAGADLHTECRHGPLRRVDADALTTFVAALVTLGARECSRPARHKHRADQSPTAAATSPGNPLRRTAVAQSRTTR